MIFGPTEEVLRYEDVPRPVPGESQLLVKVEAVLSIAPTNGIGIAGYEGRSTWQD